MRPRSPQVPLRLARPPMLRPRVTDRARPSPARGPRASAFRCSARSPAVAPRPRRLAADRRSTCAPPGDLLAPRRAPAGLRPALSGAGPSPRAGWRAPRTVFVRRLPLGCFAPERGSELGGALGGAPGREAQLQLACRSARLCAVTAVRSRMSRSTSSCACNSAADARSASSCACNSAADARSAWSCACNSAADARSASSCACSSAYARSRAGLPRARGRDRRWPLRAPPGPPPVPVRALRRAPRRSRWRRALWRSPRARRQAPIAARRARAHARECFAVACSSAATLSEPCAPRPVPFPVAFAHPPSFAGDRRRCLLWRAISASSCSRPLFRLGFELIAGRQQLRLLLDLQMRLVRRLAKVSGDSTLLFEGGVCGRRAVWAASRAAFADVRSSVISLSASALVARQACSAAAWPLRWRYARDPESSRRAIRHGTDRPALLQAWRAGFRGLRAGRQVVVERSRTADR